MPPPPPRRRPTSGGTGAAPRRARPTGGAPRQRPAPSDKLVCTAGPASGQEFMLQDDEVVIGRASDNAVSVPDTSVSRKHGIIRRTADGWALSDLGSGNGTLINGEAVADEVPLNDGDSITMGDSEFTFASGSGGGNGAALARPAGGASGRRPPVRTSRMGGDVGSGRSARVRTSRQAQAEGAAEKQAKRKKLFIRVGAISVVLLALLVGWKAIDNKRAARAAADAIARAERENALRGMLQEAKNLVRQGKWEEARAQLVTLKESDPEFEAKSVESYLTRADEEIPAEKLMLEAEEALKKNELGKAATALGKVKTVNQLDREAGLKQKLSDGVTAKIAEARGLTPFSSDLAKMEQLLAMADDILVASPEDREATELKKTATDNIFSIKNPHVAPPRPETPWLEVQSRFKNGDASGALSLAQACANKHAKCRSLEKSIGEFEKKSKSLESLRDKDLLNLFELDKTIAGGQSSELSKPIKTRISSTYYLKASNAKTTNNWGKAIEYARVVTKVDPGHPGAQAILSDAQKQAKDVYLRGYSLRDNDPDAAIKMFKDVINMTPSDNEYNQKARARLQELQH